MQNWDHINVSRHQRLVTSIAAVIECIVIGCVCARFLSRIVCFPSALDVSHAPTTEGRSRGGFFKSSDVDSERLVSKSCPSGMLPNPEMGSNFSSWYVPNVSLQVQILQADVDIQQCRCARDQRPLQQALSQYPFVNQVLGRGVFVEKVMAVLVLYSKGSKRTTF